jgi:hypothetical protein
MPLIARCQPCVAFVITFLQEEGPRPPVVFSACIERWSLAIPAKREGSWQRLWCPCGPVPA